MELLGGSRWRKSSYSGNGGADCVRVGTRRARQVLVRDTKNRRSAVLRFADQVKADISK
jgi:hypothetical protein